MESKNRTKMLLYFRQKVSQSMKNNSQNHKPVSGRC